MPVPNTERREIYVERDIRRRSIGVHILLRTQHADRTIVAMPVEMRETENVANFEPAVRLSYEEAQGLMDALWEAGVRPTDGMGNLGQLAAVESHLRDMQTIALGLLRKDGMP